MIATAAMHYGFWKSMQKEVEWSKRTGEESDERDTLPLWFCIAPVVVDILSYYYIGTALA